MTYIKLYTLCVFSILLLINIVPSECQSSENVPTLNSCLSKGTCHDCIQTQGCVWCMYPDFGNKPRCFHPNFVQRNMDCPADQIFDPSNQMFILVAEELTRAGSASWGGGGGGGASGGYYSNHSSSGSYGQGGSAGSGGSGSGASGGGEGRITQIYPQRIKLQLRISKIELRIT